VRWPERGPTSQWRHSRKETWRG